MSGMKCVVFTTLFFSAYASGETLPKNSFEKISCTESNECKIADSVNLMQEIDEKVKILVHRIPQIMEMEICATDSDSNCLNKEEFNDKLSRANEDLENVIASTLIPPPNSSELEEKLADTPEDDWEDNFMKYVSKFNDSDDAAPQVLEEIIENSSNSSIWEEEVPSAEEIPTVIDSWENNLDGNSSEGGKKGEIDEEEDVENWSQDWWEYINDRSEIEYEENQNSVENGDVLEDNMEEDGGSGENKSESWEENASVENERKEPAILSDLGRGKSEQFVSENASDEKSPENSPKEESPKNAFNENSKNSSEFFSLETEIPEEKLPKHASNGESERASASSDEDQKSEKIPEENFLNTEVCSSQTRKSDRVDSEKADDEEIQLPLEAQPTEDGDNDNTKTKDDSEGEKMSDAVMEPRVQSRSLRPTSSSAPAKFNVFKPVAKASLPPLDEKEIVGDTTNDNKVVKPRNEVEELMHKYVSNGKDGEDRNARLAALYTKLLSAEDIGKYLIKNEEVPEEPITLDDGEVEKNLLKALKNDPAFRKKAIGYLEMAQLNDPNVKEELENYLVKKAMPDKVNSKMEGTKKWSSAWQNAVLGK